MLSLAPGEERALTPGERSIVDAVFGDAVASAQVRIRRRKWFAFQPATTVMAPCGHIHFHPRGSCYSDDFALESPHRTALFVHEMVHVWQAQQRGRWWLPLMRHPFCRYDYVLRPGWPLERYGIEQQAEIVAHAWLAAAGQPVPGDPPPDLLAALFPVSQQRTR
jgi:hypothetical protein